jgi:isochorismate synthase
MEWVARLREGIQKSNSLGKPILVSASERLPRFDTLNILARAAAMNCKRTYWSQPDGNLQLVGVGVAHAIESVEPSRFRQAADGWRVILADAMLEDPRGLPGVGPLLLGGFAFDVSKSATGIWQDFPAARLTLPQCMFTITQGEYWLTRNVVVDAHSDVEFESFLSDSRLGELLDTEIKPEVLERAASGKGFVTRELLPSAEWRRVVAEAVTTIQSGALEKVVLARAVELQAQQPFDAVNALRHFSTHAPGTYQFAFVNDDGSFLGATPEQLVQVRNGQLETMGIAGSAPRGETPEQDKEFGDELLASAKERSEQEMVVRALREVLGETTSHLEMSETPTLLKLRSIQHLITRFHGILANGFSVIDLAERLHPTPAVGGLPRTEAIEWQREHENLDRGWYAGAVGWVDRNLEGEFAVAIRSALVEGSCATLFAGCGIVAGSDPEREYAESQLKLKPMLAALTGQAS